jgi:hypothetical protein
MIEERKEKRKLGIATRKRKRTRAMKKKCREIIYIFSLSLSLFFSALPCPLQGLSSQLQTRGNQLLGSARGKAVEGTVLEGEVPQIRADVKWSPDFVSFFFWG